MLLRLRNGGGIAGIVGVEELHVGVGGEFGIDGQVHGGVAVARHADGVLHALLGFALGVEVFDVLLGSQYLLEYRAELYLAQRAASLDVGEHLFEIAHADGKVFHLAEALIDLGKAVVDELEAFGDPLVKRLLQLFVDGGTHLVKALFDHAAHLVDMLVVLLLDVREAALHCNAHLAERGGVARFKGLEAFLCGGSVGGDGGVHCVLLLRHQLEEALLPAGKLTGGRLLLILQRGGHVAKPCIHVVLYIAAGALESAFVFVFKGDEQIADSPIPLAGEDDGDDRAYAEHGDGGENYYELGRTHLFPPSDIEFVLKAGFDRECDRGDADYHAEGVLDRVGPKPVQRGGGAEKRVFEREIAEGHDKPRDGRSGVFDPFE